LVFVQYYPIALWGRTSHFETEFTPEGELLLETARIRRISRTEAFVEAALVDTRLRPAAEKLREAEKEVA